MKLPNLPNSISLFRVMMVPVLMVFLITDAPGGHGHVIALLVFVIAAASDSLDGQIARRRQQTTVVGAFLDPLADKLLITSALLCLVSLNCLSAWVAMVVIARELAVSGLRMIAAVQNVVIAASKWGKAKTVCQMLAVAFLILESRTLVLSWEWGGRSITWYLVILMLVLTVVSAVDYFWKARYLIRNEPATARVLDEMASSTTEFEGSAN